MLWLPADFVERDKAVIDIEGSIFQPLGHDWPCDLLKLDHPCDLLRAILRAEVARVLQQQHVANEIIGSPLSSRVALRSERDCGLDCVAVVVADLLFASCDIGPVYREACDDLADSP